MKKVILVTDIGIDCDDAVALGMLLNYQKNQKCEILGVATSTTRDGATATIKAICDYYNVKVEIGRMFNPVLECDSKNIYAHDIMDKYKTKDIAIDNASLLRKVLSNSAEKVTLIEIGPLSSLAGLLKSKSDVYSDFNGIELVKDRVEKIFLMGGSFEQNFDKAQAIAEWNILQDISSAKFVIENCPSEMIFVPFEAGNKIKTYIQDTKNPVWECMKIFAEKDNKDISTFSRPGWDPVTVILAVENNNEFYEYSNSGIITITDDGHTLFEEDNNGKMRIVLINDNFEDITSYLNKIIE